MSELQELRERLNKVLSERAHWRRRVKEERAALETAELHADNVKAAQAVAQQVAQTLQQQVHTRIATIVTKSLAIVFGDDAVEFRIDFVQKYGKTEARLLFVRDGHELNPKTACAGGWVDVAAFALRVASLTMTRPARRRLLVLDEPFKNVNGEDYQSRMIELVDYLSKELDLQLLIVTDDDWLKTGTVVEL